MEMREIPGQPNYYAGADGHIYSSKGLGIRQLKPARGT